MNKKIGEKKVTFFHLPFSSTHGENSIWLTKTNELNSTAWYISNTYMQCVKTDEWNRVRHKYKMVLNAHFYSCMFYSSAALYVSMHDALLCKARLKKHQPRDGCMNLLFNWVVQFIHWHVWAETTRRRRTGHSWKRSSPAKYFDVRLLEWTLTPAQRWPLQN